jgi:S-adenosylmethionine:tRNA ribosyltransferase-isomerase
MDLSAFDFNLPKNLIAQVPARPRDHARLMVYSRASGKIIDDYFYNLGQYLLPDTTLVLNDSKVEKSRLRFGPTEIFIIEILNPQMVRALVRPGKKFLPGKQIVLPLENGQLTVKTLGADDSGIRTLQFNLPVEAKSLMPYRLTPFPPYIKQNEKLSSQYQTVYAAPAGSKAAPTAGLHFTKRLLKELHRHHPIVNLTLHIGLGSFAPVKAARIEDHKMHPENYLISAPAAKALNRASSITAVGTTSLRILETVKKPYKATSGSTDIFIKPGYDFAAVDSLLTNFHLPKSTLLMLAAAFIGSVDEMHRVYKHAIDQKYRFYSFGDAMFIF